MIRMVTAALYAAMCCLLAACGGGSDGGTADDNSPGNVPFVLSVSQSAVQLQHVATQTPQTQLLSITWTGEPPDPIFVSAAVEGRGINPVIPITITETQATVALTANSSLEAGEYSGRVLLLACTDQACQHAVGGSPLAITYQVTVTASSTNPPPPPPSNLGAFTLSANTVSFAAVNNSATPSAASIDVVVTKNDAAAVSIEYPVGQQQPAWLDIAQSGSQANYSITLAINSTNLTPGPYSSTFTVSTRGANGNALQSRNVTVMYSVAAGIAFSVGNLSFVSSDRPSIRSLPIMVSASNRQWRITSDSNFLTVPTGTMSGSAMLTGTVDLAGLEPGMHLALVTVTNTADASDTAILTVTIQVAAPTLTVSSDTVVLDGDNDLSSDLSFSFGANSPSYPYQIDTQTEAGGDWLKSSPYSGVVGSGAVTVHLSADTTSLDSGTYSGSVLITVNLGSTVTTKLVPVTLNVEANRLVVSAAGVAFSMSPAPGRSVLTRNVKVLSSLSRTDIPWSATSSASWLTATATGLTGGALTLTADPTGLAADTTQFAMVTVTSSDLAVENTQTIRVALSINSTAPADVSFMSGTPLYIAASPVEPIVFTNDGGSTITGYNVYTGAVLRTFGGVAHGGAMTFSDDGLFLFVFDTTQLEVVQLDATTGTILHRYPSGALNFQRPYGGGLAYVRPNGYPTLVTPSSRVYDVETQAVYQSSAFSAPLYAYSLAASSDQRFVVTDFGSVYKLTRSSLNGGSFKGELVFSTSTVEGRQGQACISADGRKVYTASGAPYYFPGVDFTSHQVTQILPGTAYPNSVLCLWNGVVIGGTDSYYDAADVWIYDGTTGVELARRSSASAASYRSLLDRGMSASGDATRLITISTGNSVSGEIRFQSIP
jgi:hypothetical protein